MGKVVPHQFVSPVPADVVERLDRAVLGLDHNHRHTGPRRRQLFGELAAGARQALHSPEIEPGSFEDCRTLGLEERRIDRVRVIHRSGAQFGIVFCPAPNSWLREVGQRRYLSCRFCSAFSSSTPKVLSAIARPM